MKYFYSQIEFYSFKRFGKVTTLFLSLFVFCSMTFLTLLTTQGQTNRLSWTADQIQKANTAKDIFQLSDIEKDAILYINLARLYPKDFEKIELKYYFGTDKYVDIYKNAKEKKSLTKQLKKASSMNPLIFDSTLFEDAKCFSKELGEVTLKGHKRYVCKKNNYAECLSYGMTTGKDIAMQLLIDKNVASMGHRKICLDSSYKKIAISVNSHKKWDTCAVAELTW